MTTEQPDQYHRCKGNGARIEINYVTNPCEGENHQDPIPVFFRVVVAYYLSSALTITSNKFHVKFC